jgi:SAM-dependent methyltransferase
MDHGFDYRWLMNPEFQATIESTWKEKSGIDPRDYEGKRVLDVGCGAGRNMSLFKNSIIHGVDSSFNAVNSARTNCPYATVCLQDILSDLTLGKEFDLVYSHGVLHHTGDTAKAFKWAADRVKPGGVLSVWVYTKPVEDDLMPYMQFLHDITKSCPPEKLYAACEKWVPEIRKLNGDAWDALRQVLRVSRSSDLQEAISDTFDWHCPQHRDWLSVDDLLGLFIDNGFTVDWIGTFPVSMRGIKNSD